MGEKRRIFGFSVSQRLAVRERHAGGDRKLVRGVGEMAQAQEHLTVGESAGQKEREEWSGAC